MLSRLDEGFESRHTRLNEDKLVRCVRPNPQTTLDERVVARAFTVVIMDVIESKIN